VKACDHRRCIEEELESGSFLSREGLYLRQICYLLADLLEVLEGAQVEDGPQQTEALQEPSLRDRIRSFLT
jgi:hypothetical protein